MAYNMYSDADTSAAPAAAPEKESAPEEGGEQEEYVSATAEIPKSVLGGKDFKVGDEVVLKIVQMGENSVVVEYASEEGGKEEAPTAEAAAPASAPAPGSMAEMMG